MIILILMKIMIMILIVLILMWKCNISNERIILMWK